MTICSICDCMNVSRKTFWLISITFFFRFIARIFYRSINYLLELCASLARTDRTLVLMLYLGITLACIWTIRGILRVGSAALLNTINLKQFSAVPWRVFERFVFVVLEWGRFQCHYLDRQATALIYITFLPQDHLRRIFLPCHA